VPGEENRAFLVLLLENKLKEIEYLKILQESGTIAKRYG
jgi:hypothetical protein